MEYDIWQMIYMLYIRYTVTHGVPVFVYSGLPSPTLFPHTNMSTLLKNNSHDDE